MIMLTLPESGVRSLMNAMLTRDVFDMYTLRGCVIQSFARFDIEGMGNKWEKMRPYVYNIIKGNEKPRFLKIVFACPEPLLDDFPNAAALFINIVLDNGALHITTGASTKTWSPEKSCEELWDSYVTNFLKKHKINIDEQE